jgi:hypothetical protein
MDGRMDVGATGEGVGVTTTRITLGGDWKGFAALIRKAPRAFLGGAAKALNQVARETQFATKQAMRTEFDRPTPWALRGIGTEFAAPFPDRLESKAGVLNESAGKGPTFGDVLSPAYLGHERKVKRFEKAFRSSGVMWPDEYAVPAKSTPMDQYGNIRNGLIMRLLSYFGSLSETGYKGNTTKQSKDKLANRRKSKEGFAEIGGVVYFIGGRHGSPHLHPGIYARTGIHGSDIWPVMLFVRRKPTYRQRIDLERIANHVASNRFNTLLDRFWSERIR